jgi:hypothetical protein
VCADLFGQEDSLADDKWPWVRIHRSPTLGVRGGLTSHLISGLNTPLANTGFAQINIGGSRVRPTEESRAILQYRQESFSVTYMSNRLSNTSEQGELKIDLWRLGGIRERGFGYSWGGSDSGLSLIPSYGEGLQWSRVTVRSGILDSSDRKELSNYGEAFRFGTCTQAALKLQVVPLLAVDVGFERSLAFRRHLFWKWVGSAAIEHIAQWMLDRFVGRVLESSPSAAPVVNFVLKNALSMGLYQLRKDKMNYPFASEAPLLSDTFKIGLTFVF